MPCLCSPSTHPGSFRCRLHRSQSWGGRTYVPRSGEDLEISTDSLIENCLNKDPKSNLKPVPSLPAPSRTPNVRSPPKGTSRLRNMVCSSDEEDEVVKPSVPVTERMPSMKMATGTGGSYASAPGGRATMFRMLKTGQPISRIYS